MFKLEKLTTLKVWTIYKPHGMEIIQIWIYQNHAHYIFRVAFLIWKCFLGNDLLSLFFTISNCRVLDVHVLLNCSIEMNMYMYYWIVHFCLRSQDIWSSSPVSCRSKLFFSQTVHPVSWTKSVWDWSGYRNQQSFGLLLKPMCCIVCKQHKREYHRQAHTCAPWQ